jgi:hypothetical protein
MVVINQQYDAYQTLADQMSQKDLDRSSENVVAVYPGLTQVNCGSCNLHQYNMTLSNIGGVGVQVIRVYINSTQQTTGCTTTNANAKGPCLLSPTLSPFASMSFSQADSSISTGEFNHIIRLWLPTTITLPNVTVTPSNSVWVATTRGRVFSFSWPFPPAGQGGPGSGSPVNISTGSMKIAYNGTYNSLGDSCHKEQGTTLPSTSSGSQTLYFVNPWITPTILSATILAFSPTATCTQCLFVSVYTANTLTSSITFNWGQLVILTARSGPNSKQFFIGGPYVGIVWKNKFYGYGTSVTVQPGDDFYLIFRIIYMNYGAPSSGSGDLFSGTATVNNGYSNLNENVNFKTYVIFLDGRYVRNNGGCP